jgi:hypothetical protein
MMRKKYHAYFKASHLFIGLLATMMVVFTTLIFSDTDASFTGLEVIFGKTFANLGPWASGEIKFSILALLAFLLPAIASILPIIRKKGYLVSTFVFMFAAALLFMIPKFTKVTVNLFGNINEFEVDWVYGTGLIVAIVLSIIGALISSINYYKKV